ncbi:MAG: hypothetical protein QE271_02385 [Bacteriovoracaceae bacterium]|nr:hypothetical protein [Bacteriovoracaceae bacterium]
MKKKIIIQILILAQFFNYFAYGQTTSSNTKLESIGGGGNGQLVVIPRNHTKPVPYESIRAWESGNYLNFFRLPQIKGNQEPREQFNRPYGIYALDWLEFIKTANQKIYNDLMTSAKRTSFRFISDYIAWDKKQVNRETIDYKKFETAAYYDGEIILSLPVMDSLGDLNGKITKEQNQGFIVIKELLHATYPNFSELEISKMGEAIIRARFFGDTPEDLMYNLASVSLYFLVYQNDKTNFLSILEELLKYEKIQQRREQLQDFYTYVLKFIRSDIEESTFQNNLLSEIYANRPYNVKKIQSLLDHINFVFKSIGYTERAPFLSLEFIKKISIKTQVSLISFKKLVDPTTGKSFEKEITETLLTELKKQFQNYLSSQLDEDIKGMSFSSLINAIFEFANETATSDTVSLFKWVKNELVDDQNYGLKELSSEDYGIVLMENKAIIFDKIFNSLHKELCLQKVCVDMERSKIVLDWFKKNNDPLLSNGFPFIEGEKFFVLHDGKYTKENFYYRS